MVQIIWTKRSRNDLKAIYGFIANDSKRYGKLQVEQIFYAVQFLTEFPHIGQVLPEFPTSYYRQILIGSYRALYRFDIHRKKVFIVAILHQRQLPKKHLKR